MENSRLSWNVTCVGVRPVCAVLKTNSKQNQFAKDSALTEGLRRTAEPFQCQERRPSAARLEDSMNSW